jgi:hypothetical protein
MENCFGNVIIVINERAAFNSDNSVFKSTRYLASRPI